jgi:hypothetical protein
VGFRSLSWLLALAGAALVLWLGSPAEDVYWSDFNDEAWPAFARLLAGDLRGFLTLSPIGYAGSMLLRAPFGALGAGEVSVFRLGALPCLLALAALAVHLAGRASGRWRLLVLALAGASPLAWKAVWFGHPEELLTTALAVGAVVAALGGRATTAGALLGLAVATKQWAIVAVLPALLAAPRHHVVRLLATAAAAGAALLAPVLLADPAAFAAAQQGVASSARWFAAHQLWWPLGGADQTAPGWLATGAKPLIVALTVPLAALFVRRRAPRTDALLLLALVLLARCALDPWNTIYYHLPFVVALLAWEVVDGRRIPLLSLAATGAVWASFETYGASEGVGPWLAYMAWTVPLAAFLGRRLYGRAKAPEPALG